MNWSMIKGIAIRVWFGLLLYAIQYDYGNWIQYQSPLQMTGNTFFFIGVMYLFFSWGNVLYEQSRGRNYIEANYMPYEADTSSKWIWFYSALFFLIPAVFISFYISFIKR